MAPESRRSASGYEEQLRRHELAAGRALMQALPAGEPPGARQLAEARRVLTRALRDLRGLRRELELDLRRLQGGDRPPSGRPPADGRAAGPGKPAPTGPGRDRGAGAPGRPAATGTGRDPTAPAAGGRGARAAGRRPAELYRYEAAANAIDEVLDRWEARRAQLASEIERRTTRRR